MRNILYSVAGVILLYWTLGTFVWHFGNIVHALLVLAVLTFLSADFPNSKLTE